MSTNLGYLNNVKSENDTKLSTENFYNLMDLLQRFRSLWTEDLNSKLDKIVTGKTTMDLIGIFLDSEDSSIEDISNMFEKLHVELKDINEELSLLSHDISLTLLKVNS